jgi:hypothetical protein
VVMMDMTGWSCPISTTHQTEWKTARCLALQGYATAQSRVTSVTHTHRGIPLSIKGGPGHDERRGRKRESKLN